MFLDSFVCLFGFFVLVGRGASDAVRGPKYLVSGKRISFSNQSPFQNWNLLNKVRFSPSMLNIDRPIKKNLKLSKCETVRPAQESPCSLCFVRNLAAS